VGVHIRTGVKQKLECLEIAECRCINQRRSSTPVTNFDLGFRQLRFDESNMRRAGFPLAQSLGQITVWG